MATTPNFYLKDPKEDETLIYMGLKLSDGTLFKYYTKCKIIPELFDKNTKRAIVDNAKLKEYKRIDSNITVKQKDINTILSNLENDTNNVISDILKNDRIITKEVIKEKLDAIYRPKAEKSKSIYFLDYLTEFIEKIEKGEKLHKGKQYTHGTIKTYKTFKAVIKEYNSRLKFEQVDMTFYNSFIQYLNSKDYSPNSVGKAIKFVKVIMRDALEAGFHSNLVYTFKGFDSITESTNEVYLAKKELDEIYKLDLSDKPNYDLARDVFLCGCYTALRFSDYSRIKPVHIKKKGGYYQLEMTTTKTKTVVKIPLKPLVIDILRKYDFELPKTYEQKVNKYIKEVCKLAKINEEIEITLWVGGKVNIHTKAKYELIKTHTARRTGATLMYLDSIPSIDIMKITGHTKESNLLKYIRITKDQTAERLANNKFFQ
jgi:integrase